MANELYIVCVDARYVRNAQLMQTKGCTTEQVEQFFYDLDSDRIKWEPVSRDLFVAIVPAASPEKACKLVEISKGIDYRQLKAYEAKALL